MADQPDAGDDEIETEIETEAVAEAEAGSGSDIDDALVPIDSTNPDVIGTARRLYGGAGAALAAGMLGLDIALGNKKKPESVQIQQAPSDPTDVDSDGIHVTIDELMSVNAPPLERLPPVSLGKKKSRRG